MHIRTKIPNLAKERLIAELADSWAGKISVGRVQGFSIADMPAIAVDLVTTKVVSNDGLERDRRQARSCSLSITIFNVLDGDVATWLGDRAVEVEQAMNGFGADNDFDDWGLSGDSLAEYPSSTAAEGKLAGLTLSYTALVATDEGDPTHFV